MQAATSPPNSITGESKRSLDSPTESLPDPPSKISKTDHHSIEEQPENQEIMSQNPRTQRYLVAVEYIGTRFSGSQKQSESYRTVVGVLEEAFQKFIGKPVSVILSSRTDAGVHALSNVCHVDVERISKRKPGEVLPPHEAGVVRKAVNHFLQIEFQKFQVKHQVLLIATLHKKNEGDIMVTDVRCVPSDFHARFKAQERTYFYRLLTGPEPLSTFEKDRAWHVPEKLDLVAMQKTCTILVGTHDFSSFRASGCQAKSPIRTLDELNVCEQMSSPYFPSTVDRGKSFTSESGLPACYSAHSGQEFGQQTRHCCFVITARARSFLYHQVRLLVGVLKAVGAGDLTSSDVERILNAKTVTAASPMAPACGLYLGKVKYELP